MVVSIGVPVQAPVQGLGMAIRALGASPVYGTAGECGCSAFREPGNAGMENRAVRRNRGRDSRAMRSSAQFADGSLGRWDIQFGNSSISGISE